MPEVEKVMKIPNAATNSLMAGVLMLGLSMASAQDIANPPDGELQKVELAAGLSQYGTEFDRIVPAVSDPIFSSLCMSSKYCNQ